MKSFRIPLQSTPIDSDRAGEQNGHWWFIGYGFRVVVGIGILAAIDRLLTRSAGVVSLRFPGSVAGMLLVFCLLAGVHRVRPVFTEHVLSFFRPAVSLLTRWMALFFIPALVLLPASPIPLLSNIGRLLILIGGGFLFTLVTTAWLALRLSGSTTSIEAYIPTDSKKTVRLFPICTWVSAFVLTGSGWLTTESPFLLYGFLIAATVVFYQSGVMAQSRILAPATPSILLRILAALLHPVITGTLGVLLVLHLANLPFSSYVDSGRPLTSAGGLLLELLKPAVVALGFILFRERTLLFENRLQILLTVAAAALLSLFGSAAAAGWLHLDPPFALAVVPRSVTTPIAIPIAGLLGAIPGLTAAIVVLTGVLGAVIGPGVLSLLQITDPAVRGLAIGASAHGIGTAALLHSESRAAAFSSVGFALMGVFSTVAAGIPYVQNLLLNLAGQAP